MEKESLISKRGIVQWKYKRCRDSGQDRFGGWFYIQINLICMITDLHMFEIPV